MQSGNIYQRVTLIYPPNFESKWGAIRPPVGLGYLSEVLQQAGIEHQIIDMSLGYSIRQAQQKIHDFQTDLIGISMTSLYHQSVYDALQALKWQFPAIPILAGGPHLSTLRQQVLEECSAIDYATTLEGDDSLIEFCRGKAPEEIKGLLYRVADKGICYTGDRPFIMELNRLPFPKYEKFELGKYVAREIGVITSRGCPYACTFCPVKTTIGRATRFRSVKPIVDEFEFWHQKGYRDILILDDNFAMKQERVYGICNEIERRGLTGFRFRCGNGIRADHVDFKLLQRMYDVGFRFLSFGVESANEHVLKNIKKGEKLQEIERVIKDACAIGYDVTLFFIIGLPGETADDAEKSLEFARRYPVFDAKFYNLIPFPNTDIFRWIENNKYFLHQPEEYLNKASHWDTEPLFETPEFSRSERIRLLKKAHQVRKGIRRRAMQHKLKKLGLLNSLAASIFINDEIQDLLLHNRVIRRVAESIFRIITRKETRKGV
ncbi:MAG: radical SAM protein [bacterium]|nr:radical SAM protein [bacterium]